MQQKSYIGDLIEALQIFQKYIGPDTYPTHCQHDVLYVNADVDKVSDEDMARLDELGFFPESEYNEGFMSFRYGSC